MGISGMGGFGWLGLANSKNTSRQIVPDAASAAENTAATTHKKTVEEFMTYSNKTFAEKYQEAWLAKQGITKEQFEALPPAKKQALLEKMQQDMEEVIKEEARKSSLRGTNILA